MLKIKLFICLLFFLLYKGSLVAQENLVYDGSFEDYMECAEGKDTWFPLKFWNDIDYVTSADYYSTAYQGCYPSTTYLPERFDGNLTTKKAYSGSGYIGMYPCGLNLEKYPGMLSVGYMEPVVGKLKSRLETDSVYSVSISINLPPTSTHNVKSISIVFLTDTFPRTHRKHYFARIWKELRNKDIHIVEFDISSTIYHRDEWITFDTTYQASGNEQYLLVGFFPNFTEEQTKCYDKLLDKGKEKKFYKQLRDCYTLRKEEADQSEGDFKNAYITIDDVIIKLKEGDGNNN